MKKKTIKKVSARVSKVAKPFADGTMTATAFFGMLRSTLRKRSIYWPCINNCRDEAKVPYVGPNKRRKWSYKCNRCQKLHDLKSVAVHHKIECGSLKCFEDIPGFVERLFCNKEHLELICDKCHLIEHEKSK